MHGPYADHILDASDTCSNCFRKNRVERVDPVMSRSGLRHEMDAHLSRDRRETTVEHHDGGDEPTQAKGVFCDCGSEGSHSRHWEPHAVSRDKFKTLLKHAVVTLERKDVTFRRRETMRYALTHFADHGDVDRALANAIDAGVVAAAARDQEATRA